MYAIVRPVERLAVVVGAVVDAAVGAVVDAVVDRAICMCHAVVDANLYKCRCCAYAAYCNRVAACFVHCGGIAVALDGTALFGGKVEGAVAAVAAAAFAAVVAAVVEYAFFAFLFQHTRQLRLNRGMLPACFVFSSGF